MNDMTSDTAHETATEGGAVSGSGAGSGSGPESSSASISPRVHPQADRAYVLGLLAVVGGVFLLPLLLGPWVWYRALTVRREIEREPQRWRGHRQATTGVVLGVVATVLLCALVLAALSLLVATRISLTADSGYGS